MNFKIGNSQWSALSKAENGELIDEQKFEFGSSNNYYDHGSRARDRLELGWRRNAASRRDETHWLIRCLVSLDLAAVD
jgi:hypothetical protein